MEKSTKVGLIAGAIGAIYIIIVSILAGCGVVSLNACLLLIVVPIVCVGVFELIFIITKCIMDFC